MARLVRELDAAVSRARQRSEQFRAAGDEVSAQLALADFDVQMYSRAIQIFAGMAVEATVNLYGLMRFGEGSYEKRFERMSVPKRLKALVSEATGVDLPDNHEVLSLAKSLMEKRNAHAHIRAEESSPDKTGTFQTVTHRAAASLSPQAAHESANDLERFAGLFPHLDPSTGFFFSLPLIPDRPTANDAYLAEFRGASAAGTKVEAALKSALDIRKFEIELYWKRAAYFWAFIAVAFAGYMSALKDDSGVAPETAFAINCLGLGFSLAWYFVNRGSKFWQENWELHVDVLEDQITGPLYKTVLSQGTHRFIGLASPYGFSVSKVNTLLSLYVTSIWGVLAVRTLAIFSGWSPPTLKASYILLSAVSIGGVLLMGFGGRTGRRQNRAVSVSRRVVAIKDTQTPDLS